MPIHAPPQGYPFVTDGSHDMVFTEHGMLKDSRDNSCPSISNQQWGSNRLLNRQSSLIL